MDEIYGIISKYNKKTCSNREYNIFKVLEMTDREVLMCRVLADFLNPYGAHGKGEKYLKIFLEKIIKRMDYEEVSVSAHVFKEYPINESRRIDIVIETSRVFIPIEVKIHANEQLAQCFDYYMYAKQKDNEAKVIYLTKWGTMPSEYSLRSADGKRLISTDEVVCISFAQEIQYFMKLIIENEDDSVIKEIAKQYSDAIKEFTVFVDKELKKEVADKICEKESYFRSMLVIEQAAEQSKSKLIYSFMEEIETQMTPFLKKYGLKKETRFDWYDYKSKATEEYYAQSESTYPGLNYVFSNITLFEGIEMWLRIEIDYNLFAGICLFDTKEGKEFNIGDQSDRRSQKMKDILLKYMDMKNAQCEGWWVQYWYLPTAYDNTKLEENRIPNFKEMNEAAIVLSDRDKKKEFAKECVSIIDRELCEITKFVKL